MTVSLSFTYSNSQQTPPSICQVFYLHVRLPAPIQHACLHRCYHCLLAPSHGCLRSCYTKLVPSLEPRFQLTANEIQVAMSPALKVRAEAETAYVHGSYGYDDKVKRAEEDTAYVHGSYGYDDKKKRGEENTAYVHGSYGYDDKVKRGEE